MPSPRFPATATLLDAKSCPIEKFDALFVKITQERRIRDGYFRQDHPDETRFLFVVNGSPYGAGRAVGEICTCLEVHEFFAAYAERPESPLSFFVADKRLLLGLMVVFRHQPALTFKTNGSDMLEILRTLGEQKTDQILLVRFPGEWAISLCAKGRPVVNFLPPAADAGLVSEPAEQLAAYARRHADGVPLDVYDETRVGPAGDVLLVTPETRGRLVEVFLKVAAKVREEEVVDALPPQGPTGLPDEQAVSVDREAPGDAGPHLAEAPTVPELISAVPSTPEGPTSDRPLFPVEELELEGPPLSIEPEGPPPELGEPEVAQAFADAPPMAEPDLFANIPQASHPEAPPFPVEELQLEGPPPSVEPQAVSAKREAPSDASPRAAETPAAPEPAPVAPPGAKGPVPELLLFLGDKQLGIFPLASGEATIGRTPTNTIAIDNAGVSRRHAVIRVKGDKVILEDLGSANGTFIRGQKIQEHELQDGDEIAIVKHRLLYRIPKETDPAFTAEPLKDVGQKTMYIDAAAIAQAVGSRLTSRPEAVATTLRPRLILPDLKKFALEADEVSLGSGAGCQILLSGMFVGKVHAKIVRTKEGQFKILHLAGLAGTRVNGEKISEHLLKHGDEIEIGKQKLLFRLER